MRRAAMVMFGAIVFAASGTARADEPAPSPTPSDRPARTVQQVEKEVIKASENPVGNLADIGFQNNFGNGAGPSSMPEFTLYVTPVVPIYLTHRLDLIVRSILPVIDEPSYAPPANCENVPGGCGSTFGIGDLTMQLFLAPKRSPDSVIWGAGPQLAFPTGATTLTSGRYGAGPAVVALVMPGPFVIGVLAAQVWSYAGAGAQSRVHPSVDTFSVQPFANYNFGRGWALSTAPIITANWLREPSDRWTVPVGGGISKTFNVGDQATQVGIAYYTNVVRTVNEQYNYFRFTWTLLFPVKRDLEVPK